MGAPAFTVKVRVELPVVPFGLKEAFTLLGIPNALRNTDPLKPLLRAMDMAEVAVPPGTPFRGPLANREKSPEAASWLTVSLAV